MAILALTLLASCSADNNRSAAVEAVSDISPDETVIFFRTAGWLDDARQEWHLPVHGWIFEPEDSSARRTVVEKILAEEFDLSVSKSTEGNFSRRLNFLLADNERGKQIVIKLAGTRYELPASAENGHFEKTLVIPVADIEQYAQDGLVPYEAVTGGDEKRNFSGAVRLLGPSGVSVISDIDDTVKVSNVMHRKSLLEHTLLLDFTAAPGMAERYRAWSANDAGFHFVSSSPWQLYEPLSEFLDSKEFPWATFSLKPVRFRDETLFDLFRKGTETKPAAIQSILDRYPKRKFVLVGDSGEQDPEVYAALMRERPDQILKIYIRLVTREHAGNQRFTKVFDGIDPDCWQLFEDPGTLSLPTGS